MQAIEPIGPVTKLLSDPARWTQGEFAKDRYGVPVARYNPRAVCWCLSGAMRQCYSGQKFNDLYQKAKQIVNVRGFTSLSSFNDNVTYEEVIALCKSLNL